MLLKNMAGFLWANFSKIRQICPKAVQFFSDKNDTTQYLFHPTRSLGSC